MYFIFQATLLEWETGAEISEEPNHCRVNKQNIFGKLCGKKYINPASLVTQLSFSNISLPS
jgi:hypothetical protein